ncbi:transposable element Tcb2 transposase [Trichonephila clavipes]|nr:transposable element Tcb2 transposase [Trichonephila clavipes]
MPLCSFRRQYEQQMSQFKRGRTIGMNEAGWSVRINLSSDDNRVRMWTSLGEHLKPAFSLQRHTTPAAGAIFQQYNARTNTARVSQDCLRTVITLPLPARSLDLSPIEHIWGPLGR